MKCQQPHPPNSEILCFAYLNFTANLNLDLMQIKPLHFWQIKGIYYLN